MEEEYGRPDCPDYGHLEERGEVEKAGVGATLGQDVEEEVCAAQGGKEGREEGWGEERRSDWTEITVKQTKGEWW